MGMATCKSAGRCLPATVSAAYAAPTRRRNAPRENSLAQSPPKCHLRQILIVPGLIEDRPTELLPGRIVASARADSYNDLVGGNVSARLTSYPSIPMGARHDRARDFDRVVTCWPESIQPTPNFLWVLGATPEPGPSKTRRAQSRLCRDVTSIVI